MVLICFDHVFMQITDLPFSLYSTFVIEARHGFNKVSTCSLLFLIFHIVSYLITSSLCWCMSIFFIVCCDSSVYLVFAFSFFLSLTS